MPTPLATLRALMGQASARVPWLGGQRRLTAVETFVGVAEASDRAEAAQDGSGVGAPRHGRRLEKGDVPPPSVAPGRKVLGVVGGSPSAETMVTTSDVDAEPDGDEDSDGDCESWASESWNEVLGGWVDPSSAGAPMNGLASLTVSEDSDTVGQDSDVVQEGGPPPRDGLPPLPQGALAGALARAQARGAPATSLDGAWTLCNPKKKTAAWLDTITIAGSQVVDGTGQAVALRPGPEGPMLCGGRLRRRGASLCRLGKSGTVQVYLRQTERP